VTELPADRRSDTEAGLNPTNVMRHTWLPGCGKGNKSNEQLDKCGGSCFNSNFISQIESFYASNGFEEVQFNSRPGPAGQGVVQIKAWWIPPAGNHSGTGPAPRIVVCHGTEQNQNKFEAQIAGFLLAAAGFGVLLPSLRDHGYSGDSSHGLFGWGWDYPYDLLAAWDYAKTDPAGVLGGSLPSAQVGLMGFSMGAFTALNALGAEPEVPALWSDAAVFSVKDILLDKARKVLGFVADLAIEFAWGFANSKLEPHYNHPAGLLPQGPDKKRKVYIVQNSDDNTVPTNQQDELISLLKEHPQKYTLSGYWLKPGICNEDAHRILHLKHPSEYRERLCLFWSDVFGLSQDRCKDGSLVQIVGR